MKTTYDACAIVYQQLMASPLKTAITGDVFTESKPLDRSELEDVVINSLPISNTQLQRAVLNVNIFVPDKEITQDRVQTMPNLERFNALTKIALPLLDDVWIDDCHFEVQQQNLLFDQQTKKWFNNIRLEFYFEKP